MPKSHLLVSHGLTDESTTRERTRRPGVGRWRIARALSLAAGLALAGPAVAADTLFEPVTGPPLQLGTFNIVPNVTDQRIQPAVNKAVQKITRR